MTAPAKPRPEAARESIEAADPAAAAAQREAESEAQAKRATAVTRAAWRGHERRCRLNDEASMPAAKGLLARLAARPDILERLSIVDRERVENMTASVAADRVSSFGLLLVQRAVAPLLAEEPAP